MPMRSLAVFRRMITARILTADRRAPPRTQGSASVLPEPVGGFSHPPLLFNAQFPAGVNTYRAYRLPWHPGDHPEQPSSDPSSVEPFGELLERGDAGTPGSSARLNRCVVPAQSAAT
jgi:hypothetical protein